MDKGVEVGGDLWIDEDWDGTQETENRRDYSNYAIVNALRNAMSFSITDLRKVASGDSSVVYEDNTGGYESVKHFAFKELNAAMLKEGENSPYREDKTLDISKLKTTDPYRYLITAEIGAVKTDTNGRFMAKALTAPKPLTKEYLLSIFELTDLGE